MSVLWEGITEPFQNILSGDFELSDIVQAGIMIYAGYSAYNWASSSAAAAPIADTPVVNSVMQNSGAAVASGAAPSVDAAISATIPDIAGAAAPSTAAFTAGGGVAGDVMTPGLIESTGAAPMGQGQPTSFTPGVNAGPPVSQLNTQSFNSLKQMGYSDAELFSMPQSRAEAILSSSGKSFMDSPWAPAGMIMGGNALSTMAATKESAKLREQENERWNAQTIAGRTRSGAGSIDLNVGSGLIDMNNEFFANNPRRPPPRNYTPTRRG